MLTIGASIVGWISFNRVDAAQTRVAEGSLPEMAAAFRIAEYSRTLAAAAPQLLAATTTDELEDVSESISMAQRGFEEQLLILRDVGVANERLGSYIPNSQAALFKLLFDINTIEGKMPELFDLTAKSEALRAELIDISDRLDDIVIPEIDDQLFYQVTGYRDFDVPPVSRDVHLSVDEFIRYRHLAALLADSTLATQLLSSALSVSEAAFIEPLQESFESAEGRLRISMDALERLDVSEVPNPIFFEALNPIFLRLFEMGSQANDGFDLLVRKLELEAEQSDLLVQTQELAVDLVAEVDGLVTSAESSADSANQASTQAILTGRTLLLAITAVGVAGAFVISFGFVGRVILRRISQLSNRMRRMATGDLEGEVDIQGHDEIADMADALEVFRRHALEVQRLNLVEKLAQELGEKNEQLEEVLEELQRAQDQIVLREKLAALGEVTAGVAHEIRNPLNFVKNFAEASEELIEEMQEIFEEAEDGDLSEDDAEYVEEIVDDLTDNLGRIRKHSERANRIVNDMLLMGRGGGEWRPVDLNTLLNEHALLAYHSARATDPDFNLTIERDFDANVGEVELIPQDMGRVFLNMVGNSCQATDSKRRSLEEQPQPGERYFPTVLLQTLLQGERVLVCIRDNGPGVPPEVLDKMFNPFFTTKPPDKGTGLGLALSNDIVRQHGGTITVDSTEGEYTEMRIDLPLTKPLGAVGEQGEGPIF